MKITKLPPGPVPAKQSTPHSALIEQLMDPRIPKTEREHAARREIEMLREALRERLVQPEDEPVAWLQITRYGNKLLSFTEPPKTEFPSYCNNPTPDPTNYPLYAAPQRREWVGLTDDEITSIVKECAKGAAIRRDGTTSQRIARAIEKALKEKNT